MTRRQLVVRGGAAALWASAGAAFVADRMGAFDAPPRFDRADFPKPGRSAVAVLRAGSYDGDLEGVVLDGLRLVEADVRAQERPAQAEPRRVRQGRVDQHRPADGGGRRERAPAARCLVGRRRGGAGASPRHRGDRVRLGPPRRARRRRPAVRRPQRRAARANAAPRRATRGSTRSGCREVLRETEVVVSMPKLKTHHWVGVTMSLKNCFGCMPGRVYGWPKDVFHVRGIPESILDIFAAVRPSLAIVDGIVGMQGDGPIMGDPVSSGVVHRLARPRRRGRHGRAPDGHGPGEGRVPDGGRPLPRPGALGADRAARRGPVASREAVPAGAAVRVPRRLTGLSPSWASASDRCAMRRQGRLRSRHGRLPPASALDSPRARSRE